MVDSKSRRQFVKSLSMAAGAIAMAPSSAMPRTRVEKPTLLGIGAGGKGRTDLRELKSAGFDVIALCDVVDAKKLKSIEGRRMKSIAQVRDAYSDATFGTDYREMIADLGDRVDAVLVSTPDHHHFHAAAQAMNAGKHVYCQKPLTHGIWEARQLSKLAAANGVKTQMGNQAHAHDHMRRCVELIRSGVIGKVTEIHTWTNRPIWPQGFASPPETQPVPQGIDWKQWVGPAPWVDYNANIAPFAWRGWWNFGTGALGDMACHIMDLGFWSMNPKSPKTVVAEQYGATELSPPINSKITWQFEANQYSSKDGFQIHWYDGYLNAKFNRATWSLDKGSPDYNHPPAEVLEGMSFEDFGSVIIGEQGKLFFNRGTNQPWSLHATSSLDEFQWPDSSLPRAREQSNYIEWYDAVTGSVEECQSHFGYAGPFTETILLGVLAQRVPGKVLRWNSKALEVEDRPELKRWIQREYSQGWEADSLASA